MSYNIQAELAEKRPFLARVAACAAGLGEGNPLTWAFVHGWELAVRPGWADAAAESTDGITDEMIREAVEEILAREKLSPPDIPELTPSPAE